MQSKWFQSKNTAIKLRRLGNSIGNIERTLNIPRSTLSGWLKNVYLTKKQKENLRKRWQNGLIKARVNAVAWHNEQKRRRLAYAKEKAETTLEKINFQDTDIIKLTLAILYLGEGAKKTDETSMGNTDPLLLKFFISVLNKRFGLNLEKFKCELHLRDDQDQEKMKKYWSKELNIPLVNFKSIIKDPRTKGKKTYPDYKGVCVVRCGLVEIQRELVFLSRLFCEKTVKYLELRGG